ncbi:methyltransferase domain-containing protein [bacterium]|nr:methyltransferase domain-containing protein [bacterium]
MRKRDFQELYNLEETYWWFVGRRKLVRQLIQRYVNDPEALVLDAGCGTGGTMKELKGAANLCGCDCSPHALAYCRERGFDRVAAGDVAALPYAENTFAAVISCDVLEHLPDDQAGLAEMMRVLRPGGCLIVTVPAHRFLWSEHDEALAHRRRYSARELRRKLQETGARVVKLSPVVVAAFGPILAFRLAQRLRPKLPDEPRTDLRVLSPWLNNLLIGTLQLENWLLRFVGLPVGTSLVAVARKDGA